MSFPYTHEYFPLVIAAWLIAHPPANKSKNMTAGGIFSKIHSAMVFLLPWYGSPYNLFLNSLLMACKFFFRGLPFQASYRSRVQSYGRFCKPQNFSTTFFVTRIIFYGLPHRHSHHGPNGHPRPSTIQLSSHVGWKTIVLWHPYPDTEACSRQRHGDCSCLR